MSGIQTAAKDGLTDLLRGFGAWRIWVVLATNDIRRRYRRSRVGQLWITMSMAATIGGIGLVYSALFGQPISGFLPYITVTLIFWGLFSGVIIESGNAFIEVEGIIKQTDIPHSVYPLRLVLRNIIIFAHNAILIPIIFVIFLYPLNWNIIFLFISIPLVVINLAWMSYVTAIFCTRYRDLPQLVTSIMQIMFFITPIIFRPDQLVDRVSWIIYINPFASLLEIVRDPILGGAPSLFAFMYCFIMAALGAISCMILSGRYARRVVFWL